MNKVTPILIRGKQLSPTACPRCERTLKLHAQTLNQLAFTETQLVEAKLKIRELEARLAQGVPCNLHRPDTIVQLELFGVEEDG